MRAFHVPGQTPKTPTGLSPGEKRRLLFMLLGLVVIIGAIYTALIKGNQYRDREQQDLPVAQTAMEETVLLPEIDADRIDSLVKDAERVDRVVLEGEAVDYLLDKARTLTPRHFEAMNAEELDTAKIDAILADPSAHRGAAFLVRGRVDEVRTRHRGPTNRAEHVGRLVLEDGSTTYFLVLDVPEPAGFVRVDGLFLKLFSEEDAMHPGEWIDGPLLVGPEAIRSYPDLGVVTEPHLGLYFEVEDADLLAEEPRIVRESPFEALWHMMAYARDVPDDAIDWESAPVLDDAALQALLQEPEQWRAQPFRIPISRIQDARVLLAGENPARIEHYTQGWIGNTTWSNVVHFKYPVADYEVQLRDHVYGRGFFLHDFAYESAGRGLRVAPVLVLQQLVRFQPRTDPLLLKLGYVVAGLAALLVGLFAFLLARDKRKSERLQQEMLRRRRARRERQGSVGTASP